MLDVLAVSQSLNLGWAIVALLAAVAFSRWLDRRARVTFPESLARMRSDARATAVYYGLRWLGICYLLGAVVD